MRKRIFVLVALAALVAVVVTVTAFASGSKKVGGGVVTASGVSADVVGGPGWQADYNYAVPAGIGGLFFHYQCPGSLVAEGGKFVVDFADPAANSVHLIGEGVRTDVAGLHEWAWWINWFGAGAPTGSTITFNVHCMRK